MLSAGIGGTGLRRWLLHGRVHKTIKTRLIIGHLLIMKFMPAEVSQGDGKPIAENRHLLPGTSLCTGTFRAGNKRLFQLLECRRHGVSAIAHHGGHLRDREHRRAEATGRPLAAAMPEEVIPPPSIPIRAQSWQAVRKKVRRRMFCLSPIDSPFE